MRLIAMDTVRIPINTHSLSELVTRLLLGPEKELSIGVKVRRVPRDHLDLVTTMHAEVSYKSRCLSHGVTGD